MGLLYRRFYKHAEPSALLQLYHSLVRPHLKYASDVWDPLTYKETYSSLKMCKKFGLRICSKQWDLGYDESVPNLQSHWVHHKLCTMFKIVHNLISFPPSVFVPRPSRCRSNVYFQPFARTNCFLHSFVPSTISSWNSLPTNVTNALTLPAFKALYTCT